MPLQLLRKHFQFGLFFFSSQNKHPQEMKFGPWVPPADTPSWKRTLCWPRAVTTLAGLNSSSHKCTQHCPARKIERKNCSFPRKRAQSLTGCSFRRAGELRATEKKNKPKKPLSSSLPPNKRFNNSVPNLLKTDRRDTLPLQVVQKWLCLKTRPHQTSSRDCTSGSSFPEHHSASGEASVLQALKPNHSLHTGKLNMKTETVTGHPIYFTFCLAWTVETLESVTAMTAFLSSCRPSLTNPKIISFSTS